ncbi:hypothetical protein Sjap_001291 [Stephania japonica]|uniref:GCF C-terminal domain-containing protein n=1 Tax=Stephania japonica TaxID=461633 RepID=A0AAP0KJR0_9MAGN
MGTCILRGTTNPIRSCQVGPTKPIDREKPPGNVFNVDDMTQPHNFLPLKKPPYSICMRHSATSTGWSLEYPSSSRPGKEKIEDFLGVATRYDFVGTHLPIPGKHINDPCEQINPSQGNTSPGPGEQINQSSTKILGYTWIESNPIKIRETVHIEPKRERIEIRIRGKCRLSASMKQLQMSTNELGDANNDPKSSLLSSSSSKSSHKITTHKDRISASSISSSSSSSFSSSSSSSSSSSLVGPASNVQPQAGEYTRERLLELQKNTRTLSRGGNAAVRLAAAESVVVLKGLVKPVNKDGELEGREGGGEVERLGIQGIRVSDDGGASEGVILDQAMIDAIRARRERLRQSRAAAPDYISLDGGSNHGAAEGLSDEEPEFRGRIAMIGERSDGRKKGVFDFESVEDERGVQGGGDGEVGLVGDDDDEDEEEKIWEEEQFRKGLGKRMDDGSLVNQTVQERVLRYPSSGYQQGSSLVPFVNAIGGSVRGGVLGVEAMSISQQADVAARALQDSIRRLTESHGRTLSSMNRNDENLSSSLSNITALENSLSAAGEKYTFMQKLRDFISVICDFLQDKAPFIEELEEQMQKLHEDRASAVTARRAADSADEMMEVDAAKRMDKKRRAEARKRRKAQSEARRIAAVGNDNAHRIEGESSTDESDSETASYRSKRKLLLQTADQIFSDAAEEYSQLAIVKERFETWKKLYSSSYQDAYTSLSAPAIFSPYVRLELLKWEPLYEEADFYDMQWHSLLFDYGISESRGDFGPDDADANLVPGLVEKVAIPILHHQITHCWDPLSTRGTKNAVSVTSLVINYVSASSEALRELLVAIRLRLSDAIADLIVPTWSPLVIKSVPDSAKVAAYRFGMSIRLLRNICLWKDILALPVLEQLALEELVGGKLLPHMRSITSSVHDAITRTERIVMSLFGVWAGPSVMGERSHKLQQLVDYILSLGKVLEKKHASGVSETDIKGLARRLKKLLVELNEYDKARAMLRTFQLKEAL